MLDWIFGKKQEKDKKPSEEELGKDEKWIYDYIKQYLMSPIWRNPLLDFIEEHCILFQDSEENKFEYTKIFQQFVGLSALLLESMIEEIGIPQKTLQKCIIKGMKSERDYKIFQQILICDNFLTFKKVMLAKNKELEVEALTKIKQQSKGGKEGEKSIEINVKQLERLEVEKAIAMSMAVGEKAVSQQEKELEQAIRLSELQFKKQQTKRIQEQKTQQAKQVRNTAKKLSTLGELPPLISAKPKRTVEEYRLQQTKIKEQITELKKNQEQRRLAEEKDQENAQERRKRLMEQREMIRKKKQDERKEQLTTFVQNKQSAEVKPSEEEIQRRRNLMKRLKEQLKE